MPACQRAAHYREQAAQLRQMAEVQPDEKLARKAVFAGRSVMRRSRRAPAKIAMTCLPEVSNSREAAGPVRRWYQEPGAATRPDRSRGTAKKGAARCSGGNPVAIGPRSPPAALATERL
jgi:hypothetical protein